MSQKRVRKPSPQYDSPTERNNASVPHSNNIPFNVHNLSSYDGVPRHLQVSQS